MENNLSAVNHTVRLTQIQDNALQVYCDRTGRSKADVFRTAIEEYLVKNNVTLQSLGEVLQASRTRPQMYNGRSIE